MGGVVPRGMYIYIPVLALLLVLSFLESMSLFDPDQIPLCRL